MQNPHLSRRECIKAGIAWSMTLALPSILYGKSSETPAVPKTKPNIILIMADDLGWGDVAFNGHPYAHTPNLNEMAKNGMNLKRFYAGAPVCAPTRYSVLSGYAPCRNRIFRSEGNLPPETWSLAKAMKENGYATGHFGKWHLGGLVELNSPEGRSLTELPAGSGMTPGEQGFDRWFSARNQFDLDSNAFYDNGAIVGKVTGEGSDVITGKLLDWIKPLAGEQKPFFAVLWFACPHIPHVALDEDKAHYKDKSPQLQNYYGEVTALDRAVGKLRRGLREMKLADNTLLWFCSDNGGNGPGRNAPFRGGKMALYEGGIRVPCLLEWPDRIKPGSSSEVPVCTMDIFPTSLEICGGKQREGQKPFDGLSVLPLMEGNSSPRAKPIPFWSYAHVDRATKAVSRGNMALIDNRFKLLRLDADAVPASNYMLFDIPADPSEAHDVSAEHPELVKEMREKLDQFIQSARADIQKLK